MPHRRTIKKGSFDGHFDELVKHFVPAHPSKVDAARKAARRKRRRKVSVHQALFERAAH
jgi:hypothetical protein